LWRAFISGTVTRLLLARGHPATVFANPCHSKRFAVANGAEFVEGDLADRALLENTFELGGSIGDAFCRADRRRGEHEAAGNLFSK
jgi:UDP-glucose 4-epimerase